MKTCETCLHRGKESPVIGDHCGKCVKQNGAMTEWAANEEIAVGYARHLKEQTHPSEDEAAHWREKAEGYKTEAEAMRMLYEGQLQTSKDLWEQIYDSCETCAWMNEDSDGPHCSECKHNYVDNYSHMTNGQWLRLMDDRDLAHWLAVDANACIDCRDCENAMGTCTDMLEKWLKEPRSRRSETDA